MCRSGKAGNNSALASYVVEYLARKLPLKLIVSHLTPVSNVKVRVSVPNKKKHKWNPVLRRFTSYPETCETETSGRAVSTTDQPLGLDLVESQDCQVR